MEIKDPIFAQLEKKIMIARWRIQSKSNICESFFR